MTDNQAELRRVAEKVRAACVQAALEGYEQAGMDGLCHEGAWEAAIDAIRGLNLDRILQQPNGPQRTSQYENWRRGSG
jgi:hypothetical protein